jgi:hypothetical protein
MIAEFHPLADQELTDAALFYEAQAPRLGGPFTAPLGMTTLRPLAAKAAARHRRRVNPPWSKQRRERFPIPSLGIVLVEIRTKRYPESTS